MLLASLLACSNGPPLAGYAKTVEALDPDRAISYEEVLVYDDEGRLVSDVTTWDEDSRDSTTQTWDGDCLARVAYAHTRWEGEWALTYASECDDEGDPVRTVASMVDHRAGAEDVGPAWTSFTNEHDTAGRLVSVRADMGSEAHSVTTRAWGDCDDPLVEASEAYDDYFHTRSTFLRLNLCDAAGRTTETEELWGDTGGRLSKEEHTVRTYDPLGRHIGTVITNGLDSGLVREYALFWDDADAPGPTSETLVEDGDLAGTFEIRYERVE